VGAHLLKDLQGRGLQVEEAIIYEEAKSDASLQRLVERMGMADLVVLSFPLYVDSLPSRVIRLMELAEEKSSRERLRGKGLLVMINSGFPETRQSAVAFEICRLFAVSVGMAWKGALCLPGGPIIASIELEQAGGRARHQVKGLGIAANDLAGGKEVSDQAKEEFSRLGIPKWLYIITANRGWGRVNRKRGVKVDIKRAPYK
jgi:hypothetical protein